MAEPQVLSNLSGNQNVAQLFTDINAELQEAPYSSELIAPKIAWVRPGALGLKTLFSLQMVSNAYVKRAPGEPTPAKKVELAHFGCEVSELDPDAYFLSNLDLEGDVYGIVKPNLPKILERAMLALDQELALQIVANPVTIYDGLTYWQAAANHPYNPQRPELGKFQNKYTASNISRANIVKGLDYFTTMKGFDGQIERKPGKIYLVTSTKDQASRARKFIQEGIIASDAGTASESTSLKGEVEDVLVFPEIGDASKGGNPKNWLMVRVASETDRPFVVNAPKMPQAYIDGLNPNDATRLILRGARYGWRAMIGAGFLWPQNGIMFVEA